MANPQHLLLPGMYVTLNVNLGQQNHVILVPQQALLRDTVGAYMLAVGQDGKVVRKGHHDGQQRRHELDRHGRPRRGRPGDRGPGCKACMRVKQ